MRFVFVRCIATFFVCDETDAVGPWSCYRTSGADGVVFFGSTVFMEYGIKWMSTAELRVLQLRCM